MIIKTIIDDISLFLDTGGSVLDVLFVFSIIFWAMVIEKGLYRKFIFKPSSKKLKRYWKAKQQESKWEDEQIKIAQISELNIDLHNNLPIMKVIISLFPLLGLLGTITGMVMVFDSMNALGTNAKAMASGISMATIPTMAGMVLAVFGLFTYSRMSSIITKDIRLLKDKLLKENDA